MYQNKTSSNEREARAVPSCSTTSAAHAPDIDRAAKRTWFNEVNEKRGLSLHARRSQQRTPPTSTDPQKGRGSTKYVLPIHRRPFSNLFFFMFLRTKTVLFSCNWPFRLLILPTRVVFGTRWFVSHTHTYTYAFFPLFGAPSITMDLFGCCFAEESR